jgi:small subunit ribosomal protein S8
MSKSDPIADFLTIIRNGIMAKKENVDMPASKMTKAVLEILKNNDYIDNFKSIEDKKQGILRVYLKYIAGKSMIINLKRVSRPGLRIYTRYDQIPRVLRGRGIAVMSTSRGILTGEEARQQRLGGEVICYVW